MNYLALSGDLGLPGDRSRATGINNLGQIIGISNYSIAYKAKLLRSNNRAVFWQDGKIEEINSVADPQYKMLFLASALIIMV